MISRALGSRDFIGRRAEIEFLFDEFRSARDGHARFVLIEGDAGIGKSRLIEEVVRGIDQGATAVDGYCSEQVRAPYRPFAELLAALDPRAASGLLADRAGSAHGAEKAAYFSAVMALLQRSAARRPVVAVVEDVQSADEATLELLRFLVRRLADARVLVLVTLRVGDEAEPASVAQLRSAIARARFASLRLGALRRNEIRCVIQSALRDTGTRIDPAQLGDIEALSEGNPLLAEELARITLEPGMVRPFSGVPLSLRAVLAERLRAFSSDELAVIVRAAVVGSEFDVPLVSAIAECDVRAVLKVLQQATEAGLVEQARGDPMRFRFRHALIRQALADQLLVALAAPIHVRIARAIEARPNAADQAAELAYHWSAARVAAKARFWNETAALAAWKVYAYRDAIRFATAALDWEYPPGGARAELYRRLGTLSYIEGCAEAPGRWFERYRDECRARDDTLGQARALLLCADQYWVDARTRDGLAAAEAAAALLALLEDPRLPFEATISQARFAVTLGDAVGARAHLARVEAEVDRLDPLVAAPYYEVRGEIDAILGKTGGALHDLRHAAALAARLGSSELISQIENNFALAAVDLGELELALERHAIAVNEAHRTGMMWRVAYSSLNFASTLVLRGDLEAARARVREALDTGVDTPTFTTKAASVGIPLALMLNDRELLERCADASASVFAERSGEAQRIGSVGAAVAELRAAQGSPDESAATLAKAFAQVGVLHRCWPIALAVARTANDDLIGAARRLLRQAPGRPRVLRAYRLLFEAIVGARGGAAFATRCARLAARAFAAIGDRLHEADALALAGCADLAFERYRAMGNVRDAERFAPRAEPARARLTPRQHEVARLVAEGCSNREVAARLHISEHTVEHHLTELFTRLQVRSRAQLTAVMMRTAREATPA